MTLKSGGGTTSRKFDLKDIYHSVHYCYTGKFKAYMSALCIVKHCVSTKIDHLLRVSATKSHSFKAFAQKREKIFNIHVCAK